MNDQINKQNKFSLKFFLYLKNSRMMYIFLNYLIFTYFFCLDCVCVCVCVCERERINHNFINQNKNYHFKKKMIKTSAYLYYRCLLFSLINSLINFFTYQ